VGNAARGSQKDSYMVATCLENLEMLGNSTAVLEMSGN